MFFFQDDVGILYELATIPFWQYLITPTSANFAPLMHILYKWEYYLFDLNFFYYVVISVLLHIMNCLLVYTVARKTIQSVFGAVIATAFFAVHLTYTEPFLWLASQGVLPATFWTGIAFFLWYTGGKTGNVKKIVLSIIATICSGFSYSSGVGIGVLFALATFLEPGKFKRYTQYKIIVAYSVTAILSYAAGPFLAKGYINQVTPEITDPLQAFFQYAGFVIAGVARGVVGRTFLPGFEPRHFEYIYTAISFLPFFLLGIIILILLRSRMSLANKKVMLIWIMLIFSVYIWAGFIRFHFGLKQALAERYAYPALFFFSLLLGMIAGHFSKRIHKNVFKKIIISTMVIIITLQTYFFIRNAHRFEERPGKTKEYFAQVDELLSMDTTIIDLPLPSYINQYFTVSWLAPVLTDGMEKKFKPIDALSCSSIKEEVRRNTKLKNFYESQLLDPAVAESETGKKLAACIKSV